MIKGKLFLLLIVAFYACKTPNSTIAEKINKTVQPVPETMKYHAAYTRKFSLHHMRLNISPDWKNRQLNGEAQLTLSPYFYSTDSLTLNARGMEIKEVARLDEKGKPIPLKYAYDSLLIKIHLDKKYFKGETFIVSIDYVSRPEKLPGGGSDAIRSNKGLFFINADSLNPDIPTQLWTQGETESNSVWFPTIEDPQQKMTQEIYLTVDTALTSVSNGLLVSAVRNAHGTRTDYWKQSLPAAPYLTMIAVGKFAVVKDRWKNIEVSYYVDPPYEKYARMIFGLTPEMLSFFSDKLGVNFPWEKYAQVVVHEYVSGAMENTTAVIHGTNMQQDPRAHMDANYEDYISHELIHHWFGDLVTCESWSNVTLNEGFANYGEYLWREYKYGREEADRINQEDQSGYLYTSAYEDPPLFRQFYENAEDLYDAISYSKGGRVLHMLRKYCGDSAFFASLKYYLDVNRFSSVEIDDLRLAFEKTTGEDLNWFFEQWFDRGGKPTLDIRYNWNDSLKTQTVTISQRQDLSKNPLYRLPLDVDIYYDGKTERKKIVVEDTLQHFTFPLPIKPDLINVDAEKMLLCNKTDHKTNAEWIFQYNHAPLFLDREESVSTLGEKYKINTPEAEIIRKALKDKNYAIRLRALDFIGEFALNQPDSVRETIFALATKDSSASVRESALRCAGKYFSYRENAAVFENALNDSSYKVVARAFKIISDKDKTKGDQLAVKLEKDSGEAILYALASYYNNSIENKTEFYKYALKMTNSYMRYYVLKEFEKYLIASSELNILKQGTDILYNRAIFISPKKNSSYVGALSQVESSLKKKISLLEEETENAKNLEMKMEKQAALLDWNTFKNALHEKIKMLENK